MRLLVSVMMTLGACVSGSAAARPDSGGTGFSLDVVDATGDVRLVHPPHPDIGPGTFDLERVKLEKRGGLWRFEATFVAPVKTLSEVRAGRDRVLAMVPQTIDVYLDTTPDAGHIDALPGRGFRVPAGEAWDRVLVVSSVPDLDEGGVVHALRVTPQGRRLVATFPGDAVTGEVRGALVVVLATSPTAEGRVRPVASGGDCQVWSDERCTLAGANPPVLDALATEILPGRPIALAYPEGMRPAPRHTPVVFQRGTLLSAAPIEAGAVAKGRLATILDETGTAIGTAVVLSVVGDTASLEVIGGSSAEGAKAVVFAGPEERR